MNTFNPTQTISSRYTVSNTVSNKYQQISISSGTTNYPLATLTSDGTYTEGYIWVPYIPMSGISYIDRETVRKILRNERKDKLNKLGW